MITDLDRDRFVTAHSIANYRNRDRDHPACANRHAANGGPGEQTNDRGIPAPACGKLEPGLSRVLPFEPGTDLSRASVTSLIVRFLHG
jgi:hypothetical protein